MARKKKAAGDVEFVYFKGVEGRVCLRYGTTVPISHRIVKGEGFVYTGQPVAIPAREERSYRREYNNAVKRGDLKASTRSELDSWEKKRQEQVRKATGGSKALDGKALEDSDK